MWCLLFITFERSLKPVQRMESIRFTVPGEPVPQPRQRHRIVGKGPKAFVQNYTPAKHPVNDYKQAIQKAASRVFAGEPVESPLLLEVVFIFPRQANKNWKTKPMPRYLHHQKPDIDNLLKSLKDALNKQVWKDDSQVCKVSATKWRAAGDEQPRTEITIKPIHG